MNNVFNLSLINREEKEFSTPKEPVLKLITPDTISDLTVDEIKELKERSENGYAKKHFEEITNLIENVRTIDAVRFTPDVNLGVSQTNVANTFAFMDAVAYKMYLISKRFSKHCVFFSINCKLEKEEEEEDTKSSSGSKVKIKKLNANASDTALAYYLYDKMYRNKIFKSSTFGESKTPYYIYDDNQKRWIDKRGRTIIADSVTRYANIIVRNMGIPANAKGFNQRKLADEFLWLVDSIPDTQVSALENFSINFPHFVQFGKYVYDLKNHRVAKMSPFFKLNHYHSIDLDFGLSEDDLDLLPTSDELDKMLFNKDFFSKDVKDKGSEINQLLDKVFFSVPITEEEAERKADLLIKRMGLNFEPIEFLMSVVGKMFNHSSKWLVTIFIVGGQGDGKSWFWDFLTDHLFPHTNTAMKQKQLDSDSRFMENGLISKEINVIGELKGTVLSKSCIEFFKSTTGDKTMLELKGSDQFAMKFYTTTIALANFGQLPSIRTDDVIDGGLLRRIVVVECIQNNEFKKSDFQEADLLKALPSFAMACMMKYTKHTDNDNIYNFQDKEYSGASKKVIDGFTTPKLVADTKSYFRSHDRYQKFFMSLGEMFLEENTKAIEFSNEIEMEQQFRIFLQRKTAPDMRSLFIEWYEENYPRTTVHKDKFEDYLKIAHKIEQKVTYVTTSLEGTKEKQRTYGESFSDVVVNSILEQSPHFFAINSK